MNKSKQDGVYFFWSIAIILSMLVAAFALGFASCAKGSPDASPSSSPSASPETEASSESPAGTEDTSPSPSTSASASPSSAATDARLTETADMGQEYVDKFIFLGDSTTYGLAYYDIVPETQVWTPASGTLTLSLWSTSTIVYHDDDTELSIVDAAAKKQPEYMLITLGVNGISFMDEEYFIKEYTKLVQAIQGASPDTKIILNSIYPVTAAYSAEDNGITNEKIDEANVWVERIANSTGVKYLDTESVIKDSDGAMPDSLSNDHSLHFNTDGLNLVINYLRTHGWQ